MILKCSVCEKTVKGEENCKKEFDNDFCGWDGSVEWGSHKEKYCNKETSQGGESK